MVFPGTGPLFDRCAKDEETVKFLLRKLIAACQTAVWDLMMSYAASDEMKDQYEIGVHLSITREAGETVGRISGHVEIQAPVNDPQAFILRTPVLACTICDRAHGAVCAAMWATAAHLGLLSSGNETAETTGG